MKEKIEMKSIEQIKEVIAIRENHIRKHKESPIAWFDKQQVDTLRWVLGLPPKYAKEE